jgi:hypothetical protein
MLGRRGSEGGEGGGGSEARGKIADERDHGGMPGAVETEVVHFLQGLIGRPLFDGHAIGGDEDAGAIFTEMAMHEDFLRGIVAEKRKKLKHLLICGRSPAADRNMNETHAQGLDLLALPEDFRGILEAEIDDGADAEFLELGEPLGFGLSTTKEMIVDSAAIGNGGDAKFFAVGGMHFRGNNGLGLLLSGKGARKERQRNKREEE